MKYNFERKRFPVTEWNYTFLYREDIYDESGRLLWSSSRFIDDFFPSDYYFINPDKGDSLFKNFSTRRFDLSEIGEFTSGHICFTLAYYNKDTGSVLCGASGMYGAYDLSAMGGFTFNKDKDGAVAFSKKLVSYGHGSTCNDSERELEEATRSGHK